MPDPRAEARRKADGLRTPPDYNQGAPISYRVVGRPAENLTSAEVEKWALHLRLIASNLERERAGIEQRELGFDRRKWRWAAVIRGLKRTVDWQASVLGLDRPGLPIAIEKAKQLFSYTPDHLPPATAKALKADGYTEPDTPPIFTETFLYATIGKDSARTVLALVRELAEALGMDGHFLHRENAEGEWEVWDELEGEVRRQGRD